MEYGISKNKINFIHSLERKKERDELNLFIAEGPKVVGDLMSAFRCKIIIAVEEWLNNNPHIKADDIYCVTEQELTRISLIKTPQQVLAVFEKKKEVIDTNTAVTNLCLSLDNIQNPGNLGTIIRLADWFGIEHIYCSLDTVDLYNPKVIQATMGALAHVHVYYINLPDFFKMLPSDIPIYGTLLNGNNIYNEKLSKNGIIIMGNEGKGLKAETEKFINHKLFIPSYPRNRNTTDSLNVAAATAIVCAEFRRTLSC